MGGVPTRVATSHIAPGADGAGLARRIYRRSALRRLHRVLPDHRGLRPADVFLASYPRTGSSWLRFLVMEMTVGNASFDVLGLAVPEVGHHERATAVLPGGGRPIKTHEQFMPRYSRAIHLVRDPRDVAVSYFRYMQRVEKIVLGPAIDVEASFDRFIDALIAGRADAYGTWQSHLMSWVRAAEGGHTDVLRIRYEDLHADTAGAVRAIASFLGLELSDEEARAVAERCGIERMRASEQHSIARSTTEFAERGRRTGIGSINAGRVEGWRERMSIEQNARFRAFAEGMTLMGYSLE